MNKDSKNTNKTSDDIRLNTSSFLDMKINPMQEPGNYLFLGNEWGFFGAVRDGKYYAEDNIDDGEKLYSVNLFNLAVQVSKGSVVYVVGKKSELEDYWSVILNKVATIIGKKFSYHLYYIEDFEKKLNISKKNEAYLKAVSYLKETKKLKFRYINMNPPYDGNLHLKILEKIIDTLTDDGTCVNLSPIRWLQDPLAEYKNKGVDWNKFDVVKKHTWDIVPISAKDFQKDFGAIGNFDLGIYTLKKLETPNIIDIRNKVILKMSRYNLDNPAPIEENKYIGTRVRIPLITAGKSGGRGMEKHNVLNSLGRLYTFKDGYKDGKQWWEHYNANQFTKKSVVMGLSILFKTEQESLNFINTFNTIIGKFYCGFAITDVNIRNTNVLWLGNAVNPRTGVKGYEGEWTDDDFRQYFDITDSEWEEIVETMKPYMQETTVEK